MKSNTKNTRLCKCIIYAAMHKWIIYWKKDQQYLKSKLEEKQLEEKSSERDQAVWYEQVSFFLWKLRQDNHYHFSIISLTHYLYVKLATNPHRWQMWIITPYLLLLIQWTQLHITDLIRRFNSNEWMRALEWASDIGDNLRTINQFNYLIVYCLFMSIQIRMKQSAISITKKKQSLTIDMCY